MIDRRRCLLAAALTGTGLASRDLLAARPASSQPFFARHGLELGVQLYALAPDLDVDFDATLAGLRRIGIRTVETAGFHGRTAAQLRASLDRAGLRCPSAHIPLTPYRAGDLGLNGDLDAVARELEIVGVTHVVLPSPGLPTIPTSAASFAAAIARLTEEDWRRTADLLNMKGKALRSRGLSISYHNHNVELAPHDWGTALDLLLRETDPAIVSFEMDAGWVAAAGLDPIALLHAHPRRFTQMHVKDIKATTRPNYELRQDPVEAGRGVIDWPAILPAAYRAGVRGFFVEQEPPYVGPRMAAIAKSAAYLLALRTA